MPIKLCLSDAHQRIPNSPTRNSHFDPHKHPATKHSDLTHADHPSALNMRANTNRFLRLSIVLLALNQWIFNGLCAPEPTTVKTPSEVNSFDRITTDSYSLHIAADRDSAVRLDQQKQRPVDLNSSGEQSNVRAEVNASRLDLKVALNEKLRTDRKDEPKGDLTDDSIDHHDEPENDEIEEIIGRGKNVSPPSHRSPLDFSSSESAANAPIILSKSSESVEDEHSEIDSTTISPLFDSLNVTLPPLSRMIDLAEQGELDILNKTLPRRILIDMDTNEEIIGPNDIDRLLIDNDLDNNDFIETDILSSPGAFPVRELSSAASQSDALEFSRNSLQSVLLVCSFHTA